MKEIPLTKGQVAIVDDEDYDDLAKFKWMATWSAKSKRFYACRNAGPTHVAVSRFSGKKYYRGTVYHMHVVIAGKPEAGYEVDHKNRNTLDNRRANLRHCTRSQNTINQPGRAGAASSFKGVQRNGKHGFMARIKKNYVTHYLGTFRTELAAAAAYNAAAIKHFGEFALLNVIQQEARAA